MAGALQLFLLDLLLNEVLRGGDGRCAAADGDDAVASARRESALLRDLDVGARHLLDLHQASSARTCDGRHWDVLSLCILPEVAFFWTVIIYI